MYPQHRLPWWRHQMETFFAILALCEANPVLGGLPSQRPVTRSFDVLFDLPLNKILSKQLRRRWFETSSCSLWRHCNEYLSQRRNNSSYAQTPYGWLTLLWILDAKWMKQPAKSTSNIRGIFRDDVIKWKHIPRCWPFVRVTRSFDVFFGWANNRDVGDLRRHRAHDDVTVMLLIEIKFYKQC